MANETLRPEADGDLTNLTPVGAANNWDCVKDVNPDDDTTRVETSDTVAWIKDLYEIKDHTESGTIEKIEVHYRIYNKGKLLIKPDTSESEGPLCQVGQQWKSFYETYTQNPETSAPWTWGDIDKLQVGIALQATGMGKTLIYSRCTQIYVIVYAAVIVIPQVSTQDATDIDHDSAEQHGTITSLGGASYCSDRGFDLQRLVTPTGHNDPNAQWNNETRAYDDNTANYASLTSQSDWGPFLELLHSAIASCTAIRFYANLSPAGAYQVDVDIKYEGDSEWTHVYQGVPSLGAWQVKDLPTQGTVIAARFRMWAASGKQERLHEFDFIAAEDDWTENNEFPTGAFAHTYPGLSPNTNYRFRAKAKNAAGWGYGDWKEFTTEAPPTVGRSHGCVMS